METPSESSQARLLGADKPAVVATDASHLPPLWGGFTDIAMEYFSLLVVFIVLVLFSLSFLVSSRAKRGIPRRHLQPIANSQQFCCKVTKNRAHNQWLSSLFSICLKIIYRAYLNSHLRNKQVMQCRNFALSINDSASFGCTRWEIASALAFHSFARTLQ